MKSIILVLIFVVLSSFSYGLEYYSNDIQGSVNNVILDDVESTKHLPFGESLEVIDTYSFTGKEMDASSLHHFNARQMASFDGRFTSPDTIKPTLVNPQSLNLFTYTLNNPLKFTDPTGNFLLGAGRTLAKPQTHVDNVIRKPLHSIAEPLTEWSIEKKNEIDETWAPTIGRSATKVGLTCLGLVACMGTMEGTERAPVAVSYGMEFIPLIDIYATAMGKDIRGEPTPRWESAGWLAADILTLGVMHKFKMANKAAKYIMTTMYGQMGYGAYKYFDNDEINSPEIALDDYLQDFTANSLGVAIELPGDTYDMTAFPELTKPFNVENQWDGKMDIIDTPEAKGEGVVFLETLWKRSWGE